MASSVELMITDFKLSLELLKFTEPFHLNLKHFDGYIISQMSGKVTPNFSKFPFERQRMTQTFEIFKRMQCAYFNYFLLCATLTRLSSAAARHFHKWICNRFFTNLHSSSFISHK